MVQKKTFYEQDSLKELNYTIELRKDIIRYGRQCYNDYDAKDVGQQVWEQVSDLVYHIDNRILQLLTMINKSNKGCWSCSCKSDITDDEEDVDVEVDETTSTENTSNSPKMVSPSNFNVEDYYD